MSITKNELKTFSISALGGSLELYDFIIYVFFAKIIGTLFFDVSSDITAILIAFTVYASGYLARFLGGLVFSHYGDKQGRKNSFILTILLMAIPTFVIGVCPTYETIGVYASVILILSRIVQGLAIGGELPCSITFVFEHAHKQRQGLACGLLFFGVTSGIFLGSVVSTIIIKSLTTEQLQAWGWRLPFLLGSLLGIIAVYLRRELNETPLFVAMRQESKVHSIPIKTLFESYLGKLLQTTLVALTSAVGIAIIFLFFPTYLPLFYNFTPAQALLTNTFFIVIFSLTIIPAALLCDKIGDRKIFILGSGSLAILAIPTFSFLQVDSLISVIRCYIFMIPALALATVSGLTILSETYPTQIRYSGVALSYNLAAGVIGGFTPLICTKLIISTGINYAPAFYLAFIALLGCASVLIKNTPYNSD